MQSNSSLILIVLAIGLFFTFTNDQYKKVKDLHALAGEYQGILQNISDIVGLRDSLLVQYNSFPADDIDRINKLLPEEVDTVRLALDLDTIASNYDVSISSVETDAVGGGQVQQSSIVLPGSSTGSTHNAATVTFSFVSRYEDFVRLIEDIGKNLRLMDISSVAFQSAENGLYEYEVSVRTYWLNKSSE